jgi:hypothetical protein
MITTLMVSSRGYREDEEGIWEGQKKDVFVFEDKVNGGNKRAPQHSALTHTHTRSLTFFVRVSLPEHSAILPLPGHILHMTTPT